MKTTMFSKMKAALVAAAVSAVQAVGGKDISSYAGKALLGSKPRIIPPREWLETWINDARRAAKLDPIELAYPEPRAPAGGLRFDQVQRRNAVPKFRKVNYRKEALRAARREAWVQA